MREVEEEVKEKVYLHLKRGGGGGDRQTAKKLEFDEEKIWL